MASLLLNATQLAEIAKIEALTPNQLAKLPAAERIHLETVLARYHDLLADETKNEKYAGIFAGCMGFIVLLFLLHQWMGWLYRRSEFSFYTVYMRPLARFMRLFQSISIRKVPIFPSFGHFIAIFAYVVVMATLLFVNVTYWSDLFNFAHRLGWLAICNVCLVTILALKNTPLAFLTEYSYEKLNYLHQVAGYTTIICSIMHGVVYSVALIRTNQHALLTENPQIAGDIAGLTMILMGFTALIIRKSQYEVFYAFHVVGFVIVLLTVGLHRANLAENLSIISVIIAAGLWVCDRAIRLFRMIRNSAGNSAIVTPLAGGGTRVKLRQVPWRDVGGRHAFLWIPRISVAQTHPFTIVSENPTEFVVAARHGFTSRLHSFAVENPGACLKASVDGPYGALPAFEEFGKVILVAGGSGATFTFSIAVDLVKSRARSDIQIDFVWVIRNQEQLSWFSKEIILLASSPLVKLFIYNTRSQNTVDIPLVSETILPPKQNNKDNGLRRYPLPAAGDLNGDVEMCFIGSVPTDSSKLTVNPGRPDVSSIVKGMIGSAEDGTSIIVAVCGPPDLKNTMKTTVAQCVRSEKHSIVFHSEEFSW